MRGQNLVTQAILAGPHTAAPPAYNGVGWLVVVNLGMMTACTWLGAMAAFACGSGLYRHRLATARLTVEHPANLLRLIGLLAATCFTMRCGAEAAQLWAWNPDDIVTTAAVRTAKHYIDPVAVSFGLAAIAVTTLGWRELIEHVSRKPLPVQMWASRHKLKRPAMLVVLAFVAAIGVVVTR